MTEFASIRNSRNILLNWICTCIFSLLFKNFDVCGWDMLPYSTVGYSTADYEIYHSVQFYNEDKIVSFTYKSMYVRRDEENNS